MLAENLSTEEKARNLITFARSVNEHNVEKVVEALLKLIEEQTYENFIKERQRETITEFRKR